MEYTKGNMKYLNSILVVANFGVSATLVLISHNMYN
jgi:hypothetical protein